MILEILERTIQINLVWFILALIVVSVLSFVGGIVAKDVSEILLPKLRRRRELKDARLCRIRADRPWDTERREKNEQTCQE